HWCFRWKRQCCFLHCQIKEEKLFLLYGVSLPKGIYERWKFLSETLLPKAFYHKEKGTLPYESRNKKSNEIIGNCHCCNGSSICHRLSDNTASDQRGFGSGRTQGISKSGQSDFRHPIRQCVSGGIAKSG